MKLINGKYSLSPIADKMIMTLELTGIEEAKAFAEELSEMRLKDKEFSLTAKVIKKKRSLDQNSYFWVLIKKLAKKMQISYTDCYKNIIKDGGVYNELALKKDAVNRFKSSWESNGMGWICEVIGENKLDSDYVNLLIYCGTSGYESDEMARILDVLIDECKANGIEVLSPAELARMREMEKRNGY